MPRRSAALARSDLFTRQLPEYDFHARAERSYLRAEAIAKVHALTIEDVATLTPAFWAFHLDPVLCIDGAAATLLTIQYNLSAGTIARLVVEEGREDLRQVVQDMLEFKTIGQFCLTEVGHGLDAYNLETTATLLEDGTFELNTPSSDASKFMPPMIPVLGRPCVSVVFAQLIMNGERCGVRPFLVPINDGFQMCPGVSTRLLPYRQGTNPVNHSVTSFDRLRLPFSALLGSVENSISSRLQFLTSIWRVGVGTLALSSVNIPITQIITHIAYKYSTVRGLSNHDGSVTPLISFRTQSTPIVYAVARVYALEAMYQNAVHVYMDDDVDPRVRHGVATCFKALSIRFTQMSNVALSERCGARGLLSVNQIVTLHSEVRGIAIAEGDVLALSIRLATELLLDRYELPEAQDASSLLAQREAFMLQKYQQLVAEHGHRSKQFSDFVLPICQSLIEAIGYRMAYDAAIAAKLPAPLIDMLVLDAVKADMGWYIEHGHMTCDKFAALEADAVERSMPSLDQWVMQMDVESCVKAPIVSPQAWSSFMQDLPLFTSHSSPSSHEQTRIIRASL